MEIIYKHIDELVAYEKNPRRNDDAVEKVANSISAFGFKVPIIIDKDNVIIAGHTRLKASMKLGLDEVPCIIADDLDEEQVKAFRLADNKVGEIAGWDFDLLDDEMQEIFNFDMSLFGFSSDEIDWANVDDIEESNFEAPVEKKLECPHCGHVDLQENFKKVEE